LFSSHRFLPSLKGGRKEKVRRDNIVYHGDDARGLDINSLRDTIDCGQMRRATQLNLLLRSSGTETKPSLSTALGPA
jgi:hypothetical protein